MHYKLSKYSDFIWQGSGRKAEKAVTFVVDIESCFPRRSMNSILCPELL